MDKLKVENKDLIEEKINKNKSVETTKKNIGKLIDKVFEFGDNGGIIISMSNINRADKDSMVALLKKNGFEVTDVASGRVRIKSEK